MANGRFDRRQFLGAAAGAAAGAALGATAFPHLAAAATKPRSTTLGRSMLDTPALEAPVDTIVVVMMENRSFDHVLGYLGADEGYLDNGRRRYGKQFEIDAVTDLTYKDSDGNEVETAPLVGAPTETNPWRGCGHPIPGHGWFAGRLQLTEGFLAEGTGNDPYALGYYLREDLPLLGQLVDRFTVCDHSFASLCAGTFPNRQYLHAAQAVTREDPGPLRAGIYDTPTIWDKLVTAQVPSGYYYTDLPLLLLWGERFRPIVNPIEQYFEQCAAGTLPNVVMVDPGFQGDLRTDQHSLGDVRVGERWLSEVLQAFMSSPQWGRGMIVLTYDEWGGFFDHVKPPLFDDARASPDLELSFALAGFRVPTVVMSPYTHGGYVDHRVYDHTSILRAIEWRFLGAPPEGSGRKGESWYLTTRDQHANNIMATLRDVDPDLAVELQPVTVDATPACVDAFAPTLLERAPLEHEDPFVAHPDLEAMLASDYPATKYFPWLTPTSTE